MTFQGAARGEKAATYPQTIVVRHPKENPRKCSILPLRERSDMVVLTLPLKQRPNLAGYLRLAAEGPEFRPADADSGLLVLDGSWRWVEAMSKSFADVPPRSLRGYRTAYPRTSKLGTDPGNGLASVEALFVAYRLLGRQTEGLLNHYRWAQEFLQLNDWVII